ncbi:hypothetical protein VMT65_14715 [Nocardia sp. CDC153]|uniref:hypothetical protein n=1 Tax=Nocardia sp. CDC153 TaxID=3112167 RepID=UPI002DBF7670|nr:hypothetical protein [Nocardia sp. CDC153]MEC3954289.1 hypothetical protein [Nocardia sp. CDC153]
MPSSQSGHPADVVGLTVPPDRFGSPSPLAPVNRRAALRLAGGGVFAVAAVGALAACGTDDKPSAPDPLIAQETAARTDAAAATAAIATSPDKAGALQTIATQRTAHADALRTEIDRAIGVYGDGSTPSRRIPPVIPTAPVPPPPVATLRTQLQQSQRSAADLATQLSGYRAGLLASISASCATHAGVLLA